MPRRNIDLVLRIRAANQRALDKTLTSLKKLNGTILVGSRNLSTYEDKNRKVNAGLKKTQKSAKGAATGVKGLNASLVTSITKGSILAGTLVRIASALKDAALATPIYAARTETLGVVINQLSKANDLGTGAVNAQVESIRKQGIAIQQAREIVAKMIFAQLDLAKSSQLARLAQDAGIISNRNSSDSLASIVQGIVTRQVEVLRTSGIIVTFEEEFLKAARKSGQALTAQEKTTIALNVVLEKGAVIAGTYEAAMTTVGKRMTSLPRLVNEAKNAIGTNFIPILGRAVLAMEDLSVASKDNADSISRTTEAVIALGVAWAAFKLTPGGPITRGIAGTIAGTAAFLGIKQANDPIPLATDLGRRAVLSLERRRELIAATISPTVQGQEGLIPNPNLPTDPADIKRLQAEFEQLGIAITGRVTATAESFVKAFARLTPGEPFGPERRIREFFSERPGGLQLGTGTDVRMRVGDVLLALQRQRAGFDPNDGALAPDFSEAIASAAREQAIQAQAKVKEDILRMQGAVLAAALDPSLRFIGQTIEAIRRARIKGATRAQESIIASTLLGAGGRAVGRTTAVPQRSEDFRFAKPEDALPFSVVSRGAAIESRISKTADFEGLSKLQLTPAQKRATEDLEKITKRRVDHLERAADFQARMVQLIAGPGGEVAAINEVARLRISIAERSFEISQDRAEFEQQTDEARFQRELALQELRKQQLRDFQQGLGQVFDAIVSRGQLGVQDFIKGQAQGVLRQFFVNFGTEAFSVVKKLAPPGQGSGGKLNIFGRLLKGTPLGIDPVELAQQELTTATTQATMATLKLEATLSGRSTFTPGFLGIGMPNVGGGQLPASFLNKPFGISPGGSGGGPFGFVTNALNDFFIGPKTGGRSNIQNFGAGAGSIFKGGLFGGVRPGDRSVVGPDGRVTTASALGLTTKAGRVGNVVGSAGAIAAGAFGLAGGISRGGKEGITQAVTSGLGLASLIPGPQQPFLQAGAMIAGIVASFIGVDQQARERRHQETLRALDANRVDPRVGGDRFTDLLGNEIDFDARGRTRTVVVQTVHVNVNALDSKSFMDRSEDISRAVSSQLNRGNTDIRTAVQEAAFS